jgi:DNA-binding transcriptional MerR regulator
VVTSPSNSEDKPRWLTHTEAADLCGVSYNTVAYWARQGKLHPQKERRTLSNGTVREVTVFDVHEIMKLARRRGRDVNDTDEVAARAFEMFEDGAPLREVVIKLRKAPERIEALHEQWLNCGGSELVVNPVARRELEHILGPFVGVAELVQRVTELVVNPVARRELERILGPFAGVVELVQRVTELASREPNTR